MNTTQEVIAILADQAMVAPSDVKLDHTLDDLGIDSMGVVECIFAIEERFDVTVPFNANTPGDNAFDITSVASIIGAVENLTAAES